MSIYIETELTLDALDIRMLMTLVKERIKELRDFKKQNEAAFPAMIADEQIFNYNDTLKKLKAAHVRIIETKAANDAVRAKSNSRRTKAAS